MAGGIALFLTALGLYAVVNFAVGQRRLEIAVRLAIGARASQILRQFAGDRLGLSVVGLALGLPLGLLGVWAIIQRFEDPSLSI